MKNKITKVILVVLSLIVFYAGFVLIRPDFSSWEGTRQYVPLDYNISTGELKYIDIPEAITSRSSKGEPAYLSIIHTSDKTYEYSDGTVFGANYDGIFYINSPMLKHNNEDVLMEQLEDRIHTITLETTIPEDFTYTGTNVSSVLTEVAPGFIFTLTGTNEELSSQMSALNYAFYQLLDANDLCIYNGYDGTLLSNSEGNKFLRMTKTSMNTVSVQGVYLND